MAVADRLEAPSGAFAGNVDTPDRSALTRRKQESSQSTPREFDGRQAGAILLLPDKPDEALGGQVAEEDGNHTAGAVDFEVPVVVLIRDD